MNHTKEPWWKECGTDIVTQDGKFIATTHQPGSMVGTELEYENARRIVACVNACVHIPTEVLESVGKYGGLWDRLMAVSSLIGSAQALRTFITKKHPEIFTTKEGKLFLQDLEKVREIIKGN